MRLIDKDRCKADIEQFNRPLCDGYHMKDYVLNQIITDIENQPTVDAVPVIRCRDCKHCMIFSMFTSKWYVCCRNEKGVDVNADDFCSYAERGNDETN